MLMYYKYDEFSMYKAMGFVAKNEENGNLYFTPTEIITTNVTFEYLSVAQTKCIVRLNQQICLVQ